MLHPFTDPANGWTPFAAQWVRESADTDPFRCHQLCDDPHEADIILFVEGHPEKDPYLLAVARHPLIKRYPQKCFLYHDADYAVPVVRGVYPGIWKRNYQTDRCRAGIYHARVEVNEFVGKQDVDGAPRQWLYTFFGEANNPTRRALLAGNHPEGLMRDTTGMHTWKLRGMEQQNYKREFADAIARSSFVLCPFGCGASSYRIYEAMEMGRSPVIFSDHWVPPDGIRWEEFSLRLPQKLVTHVAEILPKYRNQSAAMGLRAREIWEQWCSKPVAFHRLVEACVSIQQTKSFPFSTTRAWLALLSYGHRRVWLRQEYRRCANLLKSKVKASVRGFTS